MPINVYEGDRPICQCHTVLDSAHIVAAMNEAQSLRGELERVRGERDRLKKELDDDEDYKIMRAELASAEAENRRLREALAQIRRNRSWEAADEIAEDALGVSQGLKEMAEGKTKPIAEIRAALQPRPTEPK
jgi:hypothetical protein